MSASEVLVIGAGPYGLSVSAHLRGLGIDHKIVGRPMDTWRAHMPVGMFLKSEPYGSDMSTPQPGYDLAGYTRAHGGGTAERGVPFERGIPLSIERLLAYADWFTEQLVPDVSDITVTEVKATGGGFQVAFADAESITARQVVVAAGVLPHSYVPPELAGLPSDLVSHTADHHEFDRFKGRRVAVVGSGQSALETAALLHEAGSDVTVVARCPDAPIWHPRPVPLTPTMRARWPITKLCEGWKCVLWNSPEIFRKLPQDLRLTKARTVLGPRGAWWLRDRIIGKVDVLAGHELSGAEASGSGVRLSFRDPKQSSIEADHVIAGTGYHLNVGNLDFLPQEVKKHIDVLSGYPVLSRGGESTVPGLYFTGALASYALGPSQRFIAGTHNATGQIARSVATRAKTTGARLAASEMVDAEA
jgi:thioredoxin reductase